MGRTRRSNSVSAPAVVGKAQSTTTQKDEPTVNLFERPTYSTRDKVIFAIGFVLLQKVLAVIDATDDVPLTPHHRIVDVIPRDVFRLSLQLITLVTVLFAPLHSPLPYMLIYSAPLSVFYNAQLGSMHHMILFVFFTIPVMELVCGADYRNVAIEDEKRLDRNPIFRSVTMLWAPLQYVFIAWAIIQGFAWYEAGQVSTLQIVGLVASVGLCSGALGINIAHELVHKTDSTIEVLCGKALLSSVCYGHFYVEHLEGHHKNVATPMDPATSRKGETLYTFVPRSVIFSFLSAMHIEDSSLRRRWKKQKGGSALPFAAFYVLHHRILQMALVSCAWVAFAYYVAGMFGVLFFLGQSVVAFVELEVINYIEHYGLQREATGNSEKAFEKVSVLHSWNADARITNFLLFKLQRHSDHHAYAKRRYQILRSFEESPQMPLGYAGMQLLSLVPPLWFKVMDKRVDAFYKESYAQAKAKVKGFEKSSVRG